MRRRYVWSDEAGKLVEVTQDQPRTTLHYVQPDIPAYESPTTGKLIEGRRARRDDLARSNCRPWEGMESERKEAEKRRIEHERKLDSLADKMAHVAWRDAPESIRRIFRGR